MKRKIREKILSIICILAIIGANIGLRPTEVRAEIISGQLSDTISWTLDASSGLLEISGTGKMTDGNNQYDFLEDYKELIKEVVIHEGVTNVSQCFMFFDKLERVTLPNSVEAIYSSFVGCTSLRSIIMPKKMISTTEETFSGCSSLEYITIPEGPRTIEYSMFYRCASLKEITIPNSVERLVNWSFSNCKSLGKIYISENLQSIGWQVFYGCDNLKDVYYEGSPSGWDSIRIESGNEALLNANIHYGKPYDEPEEEETYYSEHNYTKLTSNGVTLKYMITKSNIPGFQVRGLSDDGKVFGVTWDNETNENVRIKIDDNYTTASPIIDEIAINSANFATTPMKNNSGYYVTVECGSYYANMIMIKECITTSESTLSIGNDYKYAADDNVASLFPKGWEVNILNFPVALSEEINEEGICTIKAAIGVGKADWLDDETTWANFKNNANELDEAVGEYEELYKQYKKRWGLGSVSALSVEKFKALPQMSVMGYIEAEIDADGNVISLSSALSSDFTWTGSISKQFITPIGPVYISLEGGATLSMEGKAVLSTSGDIEFEGGITVTPEITLEGGYGVNNIATVGVFGGLSMPIDVVPSFGMALEAKAGVHVYVAFLIDWTYEIGPFSKQIYGGTSLSTYSFIRSPYIEKNTYSLMDNSFLNNATEWDGEAKSTTKARKSTNYTYTKLKEGILPTTTPEIIQVGDKKVMVFHEYDDERAELNNTVLKYSVCRDGVWSKPVAVWDDGYADMYFDLEVINGKAILMWQKVKNTISGDVNNAVESVLKNIASNTEMCSAVFDCDSETFTNAQYITNNNEYELMPQIQIIDDSAILSWVRNDSSSYLQAEGSNSVCWVNFDADGILTENCAITLNYPINEYCLYSDDGNVEVICAYTLGQEEKLVLGRDINKSIVAEEGIFYDAGSVAGFSIENSLLRYIVNGIIYEYDIESGNVESYYPGDSYVGSNATYFTNDNKKGYVWDEYDEDTDVTRIYASLYNGDEYGEPIIIYEKIGVNWSTVSTLLDDTGDWTFLMNETDTNSGINSLVVLNKQTENGVALISASINEKDMLDKETAIEYVVINEGEKKVEGLTIIAENSKGVIVSKEITITLAPGESTLDKAYLDLSQFTNGDEITITVLAAEQYDMSKCIATDILQRTDIQLSIYSQVMTDSGLKITSEIVNEGTEDAKVTLNAYQNNDDTISKYAVYMIPANAVIKTDICIDNLRYIDDVAKVKLEVISDNGDNDKNNNFATVYDTYKYEDIEINGFQVSNTAEGIRTVYSIRGSEYTMARKGLIYGLIDYANEEDMVIDSSNPNVYLYESTENGLLSTSASEMKSSRSYAMTMKFDNVNDQFCTAGVMVRAYIEFNNGTCIYSDVENYTVYNVADILYQNQKMTTESGHNYLYNRILSNISGSYMEIAFNKNPLIKL